MDIDQKPVLKMFIITNTFIPKNLKLNIPVVTEKYKKLSRSKFSLNLINFIFKIFNFQQNSIKIAVDIHQHIHYFQ